MLVLDAGGVSRLAERSTAGVALTRALRQAGLWPPFVPSIVAVECLTGLARDVPVNRLLKACEVAEELPLARCRRAAALRAQAGRGSAVDAVCVASAEPGGTVLTSDAKDLRALASYAIGVSIETT